MSFYRLTETFARNRKRLKFVENKGKRNRLAYSPGFY